MSNKEEFDLFMEQLLDNAVKDFRTTEQYHLLREKLNQMNRNCDTNLTEDGRDFAEECFSLILDVDGEEEHYIYRRAFKDCVTLLRWLGVLA